MHKMAVTSFFLVSVTTLPLSIFLTLHLQIFGSLIGFFIGGLIGGCICGLDELKVFAIGFAGSLSACLIGILALVVVANSTAEPPELLLYMASYALWLNAGSPINLVPVVAMFGGIGGLAGRTITLLLKKKKKKVVY
jgi:hypothetical protein